MKDNKKVFKRSNVNNLKSGDRISVDFWQGEEIIPRLGVYMGFMESGNALVSVDVYGFMNFIEVPLHKVNVL